MLSAFLSGIKRIPVTRMTFKVPQDHRTSPRLVTYTHMLRLKLHRKWCHWSLVLVNVVYLCKNWNTAAPK